MRRVPRLCLSALAVGLALQPTFARAEGTEPATALAAQKVACAGAFEQSQVLKQAGKLRESRKQLLNCTAPICSLAVQAQCNRWLEDIDRSIPTIVLSVTAEGQDRSDVRVEMDGELLPHALNGTAIALNPGPHVLEFAYGDYANFVKNVVIREGDRLRKVNVSFAKAQESPGPQTPAPPPIMYRPVPALTYVLGGVALAGAGAFAYLGATAESRRSQYEGKGGCAPHCSESEVSSLHSRLVAADVSLGIGAAALIGASVAYLTRPRVPMIPMLSGSVSPKHQWIGASASFSF